MKIIKSRYHVEVSTSEKVYVYSASPVMPRIDAVEDVLSLHKELYPDIPIDFVRYIQVVDYVL